MDIRTRVSGSWNAAADGVAHAIDESPFLLGQLYGGQRVGSLTALADGYHHIVLAHHGIAVAELRGILHLNWHAHQRLNHLLAYEAGMPRRAAGHDDHTLGSQQLAPVVDECRERDMGALYIDAPAHAVSQALRLLKDFLEHEVGVAALLYLA